MSDPIAYIERDDLIAAVARQSCRVSRAQLIRWRHQRLVPEPRQRPMGYARGTVTLYPASAVAQVLAVCQLLKRTRKVDNVRWGLWVEGYDEVDPPVADMSEFLQRIITFYWSDLEKAYAEARGSGDIEGLRIATKAEALRQMRGVSVTDAALARDEMRRLFMPLRAEHALFDAALAIGRRLSGHDWLEDAVGLLLAGWLMLRVQAAFKSWYDATRLLGGVGAAMLKRRGQDRQ